MAICLVVLCACSDLETGSRDAGATPGDADLSPVSGGHSGDGDGDTRPDDAMTGGEPASSGGTSGMGSAGNGGTSVDASADSEAGAGSEPMPVAPVPPSNGGFVTLSARRTIASASVSEDGFEKGQRVCTANGSFCVTGGFEP